MSSSLEWKDKPVKYLRDKVVDQLKYNLAHNHLEMDEFEQLVNIALQTQSKAELLSLTADLPPKDVAAIPSPEQELAAYQDKESVLSILSETKRKGSWIPSKQLSVLTVMGEAEIDFRGAQLDADVTYIALGCWLGNTTFIVPPGVNVVSQVRNIMGSVHGGSQGRLNPDAPTIVIEGKVILGEFSITVQARAIE